MDDNPQNSRNQPAPMVHAQAAIFGGMSKMGDAMMQTWWIDGIAIGNHAPQGLTALPAEIQRSNWFLPD